MKPKEINYQRLSFARWVSAVEGAKLVGVSEQNFLDKVAPALKHRNLSGMKKIIFDRHEIDRFIESL